MLKGECVPCTRGMNVKMLLQHTLHNVQILYTITQSSWLLVFLDHLTLVRLFQNISTELPFYTVYNPRRAHTTFTSWQKPAHMLLTTETHFKNSKLWCGCILFIFSSRYYHRYIFNMLHAMFFLHIFYYIHKFFIALFNTLCILFAVVFLPSLTCFKSKF